MKAFSSRPSTDPDILVEALAATGARLTGSWARGEETDDSDFDFHLSPGQFKKFKKLVNEAGELFTAESCTIGHLGWYTTVGLIEVSYLFKKQPRTLGERSLFGHVWRCW